MSSRKITVSQLIKKLSEYPPDSAYRVTDCHDRPQLNRWGLSFPIVLDSRTHDYKRLTRPYANSTAHTIATHARQRIDCASAQ